MKCLAVIPTPRQWGCQWWVQASIALVMAAPTASAMAQLQPDAAAAAGMRQLYVGMQSVMEWPQNIQRMAIGDDSVVGVQLLRSEGAAGGKLLLTPLKTGHTSLLVWIQGQSVPHSYVLAVQPYARKDSVEVNSLTDLAALQSPSGKTGTDTAAHGGATMALKSNVVQVDVKVVEINKSRMLQAGLNLFSTRANSHGFRFGLLSAGGMGSTDFAGAGMLAPSASSPFAQAFGLLMDFSRAGVGLNLGILESNGMAQVLAEPTLLAISGQSANFLAGGEIPIPLSQGNGAVSIEYKSYGVGLTVSPTVLDDQRIVLKVAPESSELDYANAVVLQSTSVPAIATRRADTTVELGDGESFVIGGLVTQSIVSSVDRVPLLSQIPILGVMFKRQQFTRKDRELVIVVTPRLVKPIAAGVALDGAMPGMRAGPEPAIGFWENYSGTRNDALPGFSQ